MSLETVLFVVISTIFVYSIQANPEPEAPLRFRPQPQRFRQRPLFARQEAVPEGNPATVYGPPPTTAAPAPAISYGPPAATYGAPPAVAGSDSETVDTSLTSNETTDNPDAENVASGQFRSQRLHQGQASQRQQQLPEQLDQGSYFIQLPNGSIQRVTYVSAANLEDNSISAKLQFRPVVTVNQQAPLLQPLVVNSFISPYNL